MRYHFLMGLSLLLGFISPGSTIAQQNLKLNYNQPAQSWNEALPIGNGRLGAMVYGGPAKEQLQLNEETIWAGEPGNNVPEGVYDSIVKIRKLLDENKPYEAQLLSNATFPRQAPENLNYGMPYQTFGSLWLDFPGHTSYSQYHRELDLEEAIVRTSYVIDGVTYQTEAFASLADHVVIYKITSSREKSLSFSIGLSTPQLTHKIKTSEGELTLAGISGSRDNKVGKVRFEGIVHPVVKGGTLAESEDKLEVRNATEVILYISIGTNFNNYKDITGDPHKRAEELLKRALQEDYKEALAKHIKIYQHYFNRVELDLGTTAQSLRPTDLRVKEFDASDDPQLITLLFQFGRYLLISSSQPGGQPANLQGIWNDQLSPPWDSKYTVNINTEMNYWPSEVTALPEMHMPLFDMLKDLSEAGTKSASGMYHARGWNLHHNTDLWRITGLVDGGYYGIWPTGGAWLCRQIWDHFLFTGDTAFLKTYYPVLKESALFFVDVLQEEPTHHWLVVSPSMSPEHSYMKKDGISVDITQGTTMDNQIVFDLFSNTIAAAEILNTDRLFTDTLSAKRAKLPPMQIGKYGQLQEWLQDLDNPNDHHRHVSHLYGLFPSNQISPFHTPELFLAARNSLLQRGDVSTGWSMGWKINLWARLLDGNHAFKLIRDQITLVDPDEKSGRGGTYPNLFDAHPPFQIDGNFGFTSGIAEMLLQSQDGFIYPLPALPDDMSDGSVRGLKARGGFEIGIDWEKGKITKLIIRSNLGGSCRLRLKTSDPLKGEVTLKSAENLDKNIFFRINRVKEPLISPKADLADLRLPDTRLVEFETQRNKTYIFKP